MKIHLKSTRSSLGFFSKLYFAKKLGKNLWDWSKFRVIFLSNYFAWKNSICANIIAFRVIWREDSVDNLSLFNIIKVVWPHVICGMSLFDKKHDRHKIKLSNIWTSSKSWFPVRWSTFHGQLGFILSFLTINCTKSFSSNVQYVLENFVYLITA